MKRSCFCSYRRVYPLPRYEKDFKTCTTNHGLRRHHSLFTIVHCPWVPEPAECIVGNVKIRRWTHSGKLSLLPLDELTWRIGLERGANSLRCCRQLCMSGREAQDGFPRRKGDRRCDDTRKLKHELCDQTTFAAPVLSTTKHRSPQSKDCIARSDRINAVTLHAPSKLSQSKRLPPQPSPILHPQPELMAKEVHTHQHSPLAKLSLLHRRQRTCPSGRLVPPSTHFRIKANNQKPRTTTSKASPHNSTKHRTTSNMSSPHVSLTALGRLSPAVFAI